MYGLKCRVPGCKSVIKGMTGLQELDKLRSHYKKAHLANITMEEALELRCKMEEEQGV